MKNLCLSFLLAIICLFFLIACKDEDNPTPPPVTPKIDSVLWEVNINMESLVKAKFTDDGSKIVVISVSNLHLLDAATGQVLNTKLNPLGESLQDMDIVNDNVVIASEDKRLHVYRISDFQLLWADTLERQLTSVNYDKFIDKILVLTLCRDYECDNFFKYSIDGNIEQVGQFHGSNNHIRSSMISNEIYYRLSYWETDHWENYIVKRDLNNINQEITFGSHYYWVLDLAVSPDNKYIASCDQIGNIFIWDNTTNKKYKEFKFGSLPAIEFIKNSVLVFSDPESYNTILINIHSGNQIKSYPQSPSDELAVYLPTNKILALGDRKIYLIQNDFLEDK